ncbi:MAG: hypothetical protein EON59_01255 [Alphaproteobacteria bacterium]|nr:MAG: hypothetical protein EON59_01255 [Alphaproteobacteria bacterium]
MNRRLLLGAGVSAGLAGFAGLTRVSYAGARSYAGTILHFRPPASNYQLVRAGRIVPVSTFMVLEPADELRVVGPAASLTIKDGDLPAITLLGGNQPYVVKGRRRPSLWGNSIAILLGKLRAEDSGLPIDGGSRGDELTLPFADLVARNAILDSRIGPFFAAWNGGAPPYRFLLRAVDGPPHIDERNLNSGRLAITSRSVRLRPGAHVMEVQDGQGAVVSGLFEVRPAVATVVPRDQDIADAIRLHEATSMAIEQPSRRFEAFQRLAALRDRRPEAATLADWLAAGGVLPAGVSP